MNLEVADVSSRDSLDVSLHDRVLAEELELTAHLMVAANESDRAIPAEELDRILGLVNRVEGVVVPDQRRGRQQITGR